MNDKAGTNGKGLGLSAVIFDFDGTLATLNIDFALMNRSVIELLARYGVSEQDVGKRYVLEMIQEGRRIMDARQSDGGTRFAREAADILRNIEVEAAREGRLIEGTLEMMEELRRRGIKTGVVTRNCTAALERVFSGASLPRSIVDAILTRDDVDRVKPDPAHLYQALAALQTPPGRAAMVGDHPMDIRMGMAAGVLTIGVTTGISGRQRLADAGAAVVLDKAADLVALL